MLLKVSRPRFWLYLGGTYLVGFVFGASSLLDVLSVQFFSHFLYFLVFANIFLYGVNDWYDRDTDAFNRKKGSREHRLSRNDDVFLKRWLWLSFILGVLLLAAWFSWSALVLWGAWFLLSFYYSAPPIRCKARPIVDSLSNVLYAIPGFLAYYHASGSLPPWQAVVAAGAWTAGMHLFSAVPDIVADKKAKLLTTAVLLKHDASLWLVTFYWGVTFFLVVSSTNWWSWLLMLYPLASFAVYLFRKMPIEKVYWWFPYINGVMGFVLFLGGALG